MHSAPDPPDRSRWQAVTNESWPLRDRNGQGHARGIHDRDDPIAVDVRIVWSEDGEEWVAGRAVRWTRTHVCVSVGDSRLQVPYVWVLAREVRRRTT